MTWDWALLRTTVVAAGIPFAAVSLGIACLDYAGEDYGRTCVTATGSATTGPGSGSGSADASATTNDGDLDCGVAPAKTGSGSGSAAPASP